MVVACSWYLIMHVVRGSPASDISLCRLQYNNNNNNNIYIYIYVYKYIYILGLYGYAYLCTYLTFCVCINNIWPYVYLHNIFLSVSTPV